MGGLVQQPPHPGAHRRHAAGRSRGTLLRYAGATRHGSMTQTKLPPKNPARFKPWHLQSAAEQHRGPLGMSEQAPRRRLAAILTADVVGYSTSRRAKMIEQ